MSLFKLFLMFVKIGAILLGGGYVILPILQNEFTEKRHLLDKDELINYFALSQSLPGIVAANISMFIGYKLKGKKGAICAVLGIIFVPFWIIVLLASVLGTLVNNTFIQGILWGISIAVIALILLTVREMWQNSKRDIFFYIIFLLSLIGLLIFKFSAIHTILIFSFLGIVFKDIQRRLNKNGGIK